MKYALAILIAVFVANAETIKVNPKQLQKELGTDITIVEDMKTRKAKVYIGDGLSKEKYNVDPMIMEYNPKTKKIYLDENDKRIDRKRLANKKIVRKRK